MPTVFLRPIITDDLQFVNEVRNHPDTLCFLHNQQQFTIEETIKWFKTTNPQWFIILNGYNHKVGYIRTSNDNSKDGIIKIGCDIHPDYRRKGYATAAYNELFKHLIIKGYNKVLLEVLYNNFIAIKLYEKLGFEYVHNTDWSNHSGIENSILMQKHLCPSTGISAKVITVYFGNRRALPPNAKETYDLLKFNIDSEKTLDQGVAYDTIFVYNHITDILDDESEYWIRECERLLFSVNGKETKNGRFRILVRNNSGLSFAGYNEAFLKYMTEYDYWHFTEDDYIVIKENVYKQAIFQLSQDSNIGFVATVGLSTHFCFPPHAGGGVGITSRDVLRDVLRNNKTKQYPDGCLPHHVNEHNNYENQEWLGEIAFTNMIHKLGYRMVNHHWVDILGAWNREERRNARVVAWSGNNAV